MPYNDKYQQLLLIKQIKNMSLNLKKMRERSGFTQEQVSKKLNISALSIKNYENDKRQPRAGLILEMCDIYGCSLDELLIKDSNANISESVKNKLKQINFLDEVQKKRILKVLDALIAQAINEGPEGE